MTRPLINSGHPLNSVALEYFPFFSPLPAGDLCLVVEGTGK